MDRGKLFFFGGDPSRRSRSARLDSERFPSSKLDFVPHDSTVFSEAVLLIDLPGGDVRGLRDQIYYGEPCRSWRLDLRPHEMLPDSPILVVSNDLEYINFFPGHHIEAVLVWAYI